MKSKRIGISVLTLILGFICGLGFVSMSKQKVEASAAEEPATYTQYMMENNVLVKKEDLETSAGKLFVNGKEITSQEELSFVLTEQNIQLRAEANIGYELKGWYIKYEDKANNVEGTTDGYISIEDVEQKICGDNIVVGEYLSLNKSAKLQIVEMQDNLIIAPVFDYQYYTVTYKGVETQEEIGEFKFGEVVLIDNLIADGVNIDAKSLVSSQISLTKDAGEEFVNGEYTFAQDENLRTTKIEAKFEMNVYKDVIVELRYDKLHRVDFELYLGDDILVNDESKTKEEGDPFDEILACVNIAEDKAFSKIDGTDLSYFVKNGADFAISCAENYKNAGGYTYYEFASLDGLTNRNLNLNGISTNRTIPIKYTHKEYDVQFVGVEYNSTDKTVVVNEDLIVAETKQLTRVDGFNNVELNNSILIDNVGYDYWGFVKFDKNKTQYELDDKILSYTLSNEKPEDVVIYVLYEKISYTLNFTNLTEKYLTDTNMDPAVTYYPIKSATINGVVKSGEEISFAGFKIGDTITLSLELNNGFDVSDVAGFTKQENSQIYTLTLDKAFLTGKETVINLPITTDTLKYTLTYKIKEDANAKTMADISVDVPNVDNAWKNANIIKEDKVNDFDNYVDDGYYHIKITNLTYYQNIILKSKADVTTNVNEYYVFRYFTYDFNTSIGGVTGDEEKPQTQSLSLAINGDAVIYVVYTQPKTQLQIVVDSAPADSGISFVVKQNPVTDEISAVDGFYTIQKGENEINIEINGLNNNSKLYGYRFIDIKLYIQNGLTKTKVENMDSINTTAYSFEPNIPGTYDTFVVVIKIEKIVYEFNFEANLAGFKTVEGASNNLKLEVTVDNAAIEFEKIEGFYVGQVQIKKDGSWVDVSSLMAQNNYSRSGLVVNGRDYFYIYYYSMSENFKDITTEYGIVDGNKVVVDVRMSFVKYGYEVELKYVKFFNNSLDDSSISIVYPSISLGYKFTNDENEEVIYVNYESLANGVKFKGIPYGANITLEVVRGASLGFEMMGWYDYDAQYSKIGDFVYGEEEKLFKYFKELNKEDFKLSYRVDFEEYEIKLTTITPNAGSPKVNGADSATVKMGDSIKIEPNASLANGYLFKEFKYKANELVEYKSDDAQFALDWNNLYIKDENGYLYKNISKVRNTDFAYFTIISGDSVADVATYEEIFDIAKYFTNTNEITFELVYVPVEMSLENISFAATKTNLSTGEELCYPDTSKKIVLDLDSLGLESKDLADYQVYAVNGGTEREIVENSEDHKVTINDTIKIIAQINKRANGNKVYDLTKGLILNESALKNAWKGLTFEDLGNGKYQITFKVIDNIMPEFAQNGKITINYGYLLKETKKITVTTNMAGSSNFINNTLLQINGIKESNSNGASGVVATINQENPFLQDVNVSLDLNKLKSNFIIHGVTIYKDIIGNGEKLESNIVSQNEFDDNWIILNEATLEGIDRTVVSSVDLTVLDCGIIVQFNVQPRIIVEGEEITTQLEKWITRSYSFKVENGTIKGEEQKILLGTDILGYGMEYLTVEIWQNGVKLSNGAINVGEYEIKLVFKEGLSEQEKMDCWKYYINELPCALKLRINPITIAVSYDTNETIRFEREYNASSLYDLNLVKNGTKLQSGDGKFTISGKYGNDLPFEMGLLNIIGGKAEIVSGNIVEGLRSQKYVTGNYANIFITDLTLKDNNNFVLKFEEYDYFVDLVNTEKRSGVLINQVVKIVPKVINIENIEVYDKVYNDTDSAVAQFGLASGHSKYIIKFVYLEDDVYLLPQELKVYFTSSPITVNANLVDLLDGSIGADKNVVIDARTALAGRDKANYVLGDLGNGLLNYKNLKTIYPYQITATVKGVGNVTLTNTKGRSDYTKANLLPVGAKVSLVANRIEPNSVGYREIEEKISSYLSRRNTFACGYKLTLLDNNGMEIKISNELSLTLPNEENIVNLVSLTGDISKNVQFRFDDLGNIVIDLSQIEEDISTFCLIQNRALLKAWQIVLIVVLSLVAAAGIGVAVFFIVRRRRKKNEKYDVI